MCGGSPPPPRPAPRPIAAEPAVPKDPKGGSRRRRQADSATRSQAAGYGSSSQSSPGTLLSQGLPTTAGKTLLGA